MANVIDDIVNRTYQSTILNQDVVNDTEEAPAPTGLGAPMSGREGITSQQDVEQEQEQPRPTGAVMNYLKRLAQEYGYNAKAPQTGVRVPATTPTLDTTKMYDTYNTPLYDFMRNNEGGMDEDVSVWVRENRDLPSEVLDEYLRSIQDVYDTYGDRKQTRMIDAPEGQGELSNPEPLYKMSEEIDPGTIETTDLPSGTGLMSPPQTSSSFEDTLIERLIDEEQFKGEAYRATKGEEYLTIGYGHYGKDVKKGDTITQEEALELLRKDVNDRMPAIRKAIPKFDDLSDTLKVEIAQSWFRGGMSGSPKTIKLINAGKFEEAAEEFLDNDEYRTARERGRAGIIPRMDAVADALRNES